MSKGVGVLLDDRRHPPLRTVVGTLLSRATFADFAIARVRLTAVDLAEHELRNVRRCRVLLGRLDAETLSAPVAEHGMDRDWSGDAAGDGGSSGGSGVRPVGSAGARLDALRAFLGSGRVAVRTAGATLWLPDFSVLGGLPVRDGISAGAVCLVGAHYFARPYPTRGPALTCLLSDSGSVTSAAERFDELWELGYDVLPVITETLDALRGAAALAMPR